MIDREKYAGTLVKVTAAMLPLVEKLHFALKDEENTAKQDCTAEDYMPSYDSTVAELAIKHFAADQYDKGVPSDIIKLARHNAAALVYDLCATE